MPGSSPVVDERIQRFQEYLIGEYEKYRQKTKRWRPSISEFARYLNVSQASLDHWLNGTRVPDLANAIRLAETLGADVFDILGYPHMMVVNDPKLRFVIDMWEILDDDVKAEIIQVFEREGTRKR